MPLVVPNEGKLFLLDMLMRRDVGADDAFILGLYRVAIDPLRTTVLTDLIEANFAGYEPVILTRALWPIPFLISSKAQTNWGTDYVQWYASAGEQIIYGYYVRDAGSNFCLWLQAFAGPKTVTDQDPILVQPVLQATSIFDPS